MVFLIFWYFVDILLAAEQKRAASRGDDGIRTGFGKKKRINVEINFEHISLYVIKIFFMIIGYFLMRGDEENTRVPTRARALVSNGVRLFKRIKIFLFKRFYKQYT